MKPTKKLWIIDLELLCNQIDQKYAILFVVNFNKICNKTVKFTYEQQQDMGLWLTDLNWKLKKSAATNLFLEYLVKIILFGGIYSKFSIKEGMIYLESQSEPKNIKFSVNFLKEHEICQISTLKDDQVEVKEEKYETITIIYFW